MHCEVTKNQFLLNYIALNNKPFLGGAGHQGELHWGNLIEWTNMAAAPEATSELRCTLGTAPTEKVGVKRNTC